MALKSMQAPLMDNQSPVEMVPVSSKKNQLPLDDEMFIYNTRDYSASAYEMMQKYLFLFFQSKKWKVFLV